MFFHPWSEVPTSESEIKKCFELFCAKLEHAVFSTNVSEKLQFINNLDKFNSIQALDSTDSRGDLRSNADLNAITVFQLNDLTKEIRNKMNSGLIGSDASLNLDFSK